MEAAKRIQINLLIKKYKYLGDLKDIMKDVCGREGGREGGREEGRKGGRERKGRREGVCIACYFRGVYILRIS